MSHALDLVDSLSFINRISTKILSTLSYSLYVVVVVFRRHCCIIHFVIMVVHTAEGGQNPPFKINPPPFYFNSNSPQKPYNWETGSVREIVYFDDRHMTDRQKIHTEQDHIVVGLKPLWIPQGELLPYKKVVMHLVTNLELITLNQKLHHTVEQNKPM